MFKGSDLVFKIPSLDMEHVYYDLIPNLFIFQALYGDLGGFLVKKKKKTTQTLWITQRGDGKGGET